MESPITPDSIARHILDELGDPPAGVVERINVILLRNQQDHLGQTSGVIVRDVLQSGNIPDRLTKRVVAAYWLAGWRVESDDDTVWAFTPR